MYVLLILGIVTVIYGGLVFFSVLSPYSVSVSMDGDMKKLWGRYQGMNRICWGLALGFLYAWLQMDSIVFLILAILALVAAFGCVFLQRKKLSCKESLD